MLSSYINYSSSDTTSDSFLLYLRNYYIWLILSLLSPEPMAVFKHGSKLLDAQSIKSSFSQESMEDMVLSHFWDSFRRGHATTTWLSCFTCSLDGPSWDVLSHDPNSILGEVQASRTGICRCFCLSSLLTSALEPFPLRH